MREEALHVHAYQERGIIYTPPARLDRTSPWAVYVSRTETITAVLSPRPSSLIEYINPSHGLSLICAVELHTYQVHLTQLKCYSNKGRHTIHDQSIGLHCPGHIKSKPSNTSITNMRIISFLLGLLFCLMAHGSAPPTEQPQLNATRYPPICWRDRHAIIKAINFEIKNFDYPPKASEKADPNTIHHALQVASLRLGLGLDTDYTTLERINSTKDPAEARDDAFWLGGLG